MPPIPKLFDVKIWGTVRTADDIRDDINLKVSDIEAKLLGSWPMDQSPPLLPLLRRPGEQKLGILPSTLSRDMKKTLTHGINYGMERKFQEELGEEFRNVTVGMNIEWRNERVEEEKEEVILSEASTLLKDYEEELKSLEQDDLTEAAEVLVSYEDTMFDFDLKALFEISLSEGYDVLTDEEHVFLKALTKEVKKTKNIDKEYHFTTFQSNKLNEIAARLERDGLW